MPSLSIALGVGGTTVCLTTDEKHREHLRRLALVFPMCRSVSPNAIEVELDGFLRQLRSLAEWPNGDVQWQPDAKRLATDSLRDAARAEALLHSPPHDPVPYALGDDWKGGLTPFQEHDLCKLLALTHGANFSVPGAGKTRVGLAAYAAQRHAGNAERLLVVAPKSAFDSWISENREVFPHRPISMHAYVGGIRPGAEAVIINYERLSSARAELAMWLRARPAMMILDEAHRMKLGSDGAYGAACLALGPLARHRLILTGTPAPNGAEDLKNLLGFVWPGRGQQVVSDAVGTGDLGRASVVLRPFFTRTTKTELGLPPVRTRMRQVDLPPLHAEIYRALAGQMSARAMDQAGDLEAIGRIMVYLMMAADTPALLATGATRYEPLCFRVPPLDAPPGADLLGLMQDLPSYEIAPKYRETLAIVADNAANGRKTLVWSTFVRSLTSLAKMLQSYSPAVVYGGSEDRDAEIRRFRDDPHCMVLLSNPATLGEGISLHHVCHDAIYVDRDFAAGRYLQSLDRIHRLGLAPGTDTNITVLVARGTIDEIIDVRLAAKLLFLSAILDDPNIEALGSLDDEPSVGADLDIEDIRALMGHLNATAP